MRFDLLNIDKLDITVYISDIINIQVCKSSNSLIIDYVKDSYMRIQKIPIYLYDKSIVTIEFANNTINILIDDIIEYILKYTSYSPMNNYISVNSNFSNIYTNKNTTINKIIILEIPDVTDKYVFEYEENTKQLNKIIDSI